MPSRRPLPPLHVPAVLASAVLLLTCLALSPPPAGAQEDNPPDGVFDWPVGAVVDNTFWPLRDTSVSQNFYNVDGPRGFSITVCGRPHAGIDLTRPNGSDAANLAVHAIADGVALCEAAFSPGRALLVEHPLPDGTSVYALYGHMNNCNASLDDCAGPGETVERGETIGTIAPDGGNSHLHFEIRTFPYWETPGSPNSCQADEGPTFSLPDGIAQASGRLCAGRGYAEAPQGTDLDEGYLDPVEFIHAHRPPLPDQLRIHTVQQLNIRSLPGMAGLDLGDLAAGDVVEPLALVRDSTYQCGATRTRSDSSCVRSSSGSDTTQQCNDQLLDCRVGAVGQNCHDDCTNGACDWWYLVRTTLDGAPVTGYIQAFDKGGYGASFWASEVSVAAADTTPFEAPDDQALLLEHTFDQSAVGGRTAFSSVDRGFLPGDLRGTVTHEPLFPELPVAMEDWVLALDGGTGFVEIEDSPVLDGTSLAFDVAVEPASDTSVDVVAARWDSTDPARQRWRLEFLPLESETRDGNTVEIPRRLALTVRGSDGTSTATFHLPGCDHLETWATVGGRYDATDGLRLYWNGRLVAEGPAVGDLVGGAGVPLRLGSDASDAANDPSRFDGRLEDLRLWGTDPRRGNLDVAFVVDTTGSMGDDLDFVQERASQIVSAIFSRFASVRVAVVDFRDFPVSPYGGPEDYPFNVRRDFTEVRESSLVALRSLDLGWGNDFPESVYAGLMGTIDGLEPYDAAVDEGLPGLGAVRSLEGWRATAVKAILLMGDAPAQDPEPYTDLTLPDVVLAALAGGKLVLDQGPGGGDENPDGVGDGLEVTVASSTVQPIRIFPVLIGSSPAVEATYRPLAEETGGRLLTAASASEVVDALLEAIGDIGDLPPTEPEDPTLRAVGHGTPGTVVAVDPADGAGQVVQLGGAPLAAGLAGVTAAARDGDVLYLATGDGDDALHRLDLATGTAELVGAFGGGASNVQALDLAPAAATAHGFVPGRLYGVSIDGLGGCNPNCLFEIDPATGAATALAGLSLNQGRGASFHPSTGELWVLDAGGNGLYTVDATGARVHHAWLPGANSTAGTGLGTAYGLAHGTDGRLFALDVSHGVLVEIDPAAGTAVWVGGFGSVDDGSGGFDLQGLD